MVVLSYAMREVNSFSSMTDATHIVRVTCVLPRMTTPRSSESDFATLLFEATPDGDGNLLKKGVFDKLWEINAKVLDLEVG